MTSGQNFCTECGAPLVPGTRFCGQCGHAVAGAEAVTPVIPHAAPALPQSSPLTGTGGERILGIVPFLEQGLISVIHYTLVVTSTRLIFCTWDPDTDEAMSDADDAVMQESCDISETKDEIAHFRAKNWEDGPWQRYRSMPPDTAGAAPGSITIPLSDIAGADIICENTTSTQDELYIEEGGRTHTFDLMHSQGQYLAGILRPVLGNRLTVADKLHRRGKIDRLLTGQEYK